MSFSESIQTAPETLPAEVEMSLAKPPEFHHLIGKQLVMREKNRGLFFRAAQALALTTQLSSRRSIGLRHLMPIRLLCVVTVWGFLAWKNHSYPFAIVSAALFWLGATHFLCRAFAKGIGVEPDDPGISFFARLAPIDRPELCFRWHEPLFFLIVGVFLCARVSPPIGTWLIVCALATAYVERVRFRLRIFQLMQWREPEGNQ